MVAYVTWDVLAGVALNCHWLVNVVVLQNGRVRNHAFYFLNRLVMLGKPVPRNAFVQQSAKRLTHIWEPWEKFGQICHKLDESLNSLHILWCRHYQKTFVFFLGRSVSLPLIWKCTALSVFNCKIFTWILQDILNWQCYCFFFWLNHVLDWMSTTA